MVVTTISWVIGVNPELFSWLTSFGSGNDQN